MSDPQDQTPTQPAETYRPNKRFWPFIFYIVPVIVTLVIGVLAQISIRNACLALPVESQGECGAGWLQIFVIPATYIALFISWIILMIGVIHLFSKLSRDRKDSEKSLYIITGVLLGVFGSAIGFSASLSLISSIY